MAAATIPDQRQTVTFEDVWKSLQEVSEMQKETSRQIQETKLTIEENGRQIKETSRQVKETGRQMKETGKQMKETDKRMGDLSNRFGELAEHLVCPGIEARFNELGYHFNEVSPGGHKIMENKKVIAEIDILLENSDTIMAIEVKVKPAVKDVEEVIKRIETLRNWRNKRNDNRKIQGAIAGAIFGAAQKKATARAGLFVIQQSGDTMKIDLPEGFTPREW